jgi:hypothetical protein
MKKMSFRVSGARSGDAARPAVDRAESQAKPVDTLAMLPRAPVRKPLRPASVIAVAFGPEDYATAEDYE